MTCQNCTKLQANIELLQNDLRLIEADLRKQRRQAQALKQEFARLMQEHPKSPEVQTVLEYWQAAISPKAKIPPDGIRAQKILARLRDTYTVDELCRVIDACVLSDWHMGRDPKTQGKTYNDLTFLMRDEATVERFLGMYSPTIHEQEK